MWVVKYVLYSLNSWGWLTPGPLNIHNYPYYSALAVFNSGCWLFSAVQMSSTNIPVKWTEWSYIFIHLQQHSSHFLFEILFSCQVNITKWFSFCYSGNFYKLCSGKKQIFICLAYISQYGKYLENELRVLYSDTEGLKIKFIRLRSP